MVLVKLKTCDNFEVTVERVIIRKSKMIILTLNTLARTANPNVSEEELKKIQEEYENPDPIFLEKVNKDTFNIVINWCELNQLKPNDLDRPDRGSTYNLSDEDSDFFQTLDNRELMDLLKSAHYLEIPTLVFPITMKIRDKGIGCRPEEFRRIFEI